MKNRVWKPEMSDAETKDLAYWERNMLALRYADGWYNDDVQVADLETPQGAPLMQARFAGWRRVLTLDMGAITFHIPDDFDVGALPEVHANWDGHTTEQKWARIAARWDIKLEELAP